MPLKEKLWDVVVIGGGPAGLSAAMVLSRSRRSVLVLDEGRQRNRRSQGLHNFLTRDGILPLDFLALAHEELSRYPVSFVKSRAVKATKDYKRFVITDDSGKDHVAKRILLATGVTDNIPSIPGMEELWGCAVFHCPFCDGFECKETHVGLYSHRHNGFGMAIALSHLSKKVSLFTDGAFYLKPAQKEQLSKKGIEVYTRKIARLIHTSETLQGVELTDGRKISCTSMFTNHGLQVNRTLLDQLGCRSTKKGAAITNRRQQTNIPGVYVAGDASIDMHFVVVASAEGVKAAVAIHNDLIQEENQEAMKVKDQ